MIRKTVPLILAGAFLLLLLTAMTVPQLLTSYHPLAADSTAVTQPPSFEHLFGTDASGRDVFARVVYGSSATITLAAGAVLTALTIGTLFGLLASFSGRFIDTVIARVNDILLAFPEFLIALVVVAIAGKGPDSIALGVTLGMIPVYVRMGRVQGALAKNSEYLLASRILGVHPLRSVFSHVVPKVFSELMILAIIGFGTAVAASAALSFLGLGLQPPEPEWGVMMSEGRGRLGDAWWITGLSGLVLALTVVSVTVSARGLERKFGVGR